MKTAKSNPELIVEGAKCKVQLLSSWVGADTTEPTVWLPAKIKEVVTCNNDPTMISAIITDIRASHKYKTPRIERMLYFHTQFDRIKFK